MKNKFKVFGIFFLFCLNATFGQTINKNDFQSPPNSAKPRVWWHWMNGNISKDGIQKDLDWMERIGIGGFHNFDANLFTPVVVPKKLVFMTPDWKDAFKFTTDLAIKKGFEMTIAGSPGWSVTGGPWVEPQDAMKKYVYSETIIEGGKSVKTLLQSPPNVTGKFQNDEIQDAGLTGGFIGKKPNFYKDVAVIAYKLPISEKSMQELNPKVTTSAGTQVNLETLTSSAKTEKIDLPAMAIGEDMWIQYEFENPQTFKAFSVSGSSADALAEFNGVPKNRSLKISDDGVNFKEIATISGSTVPFNTVGFDPTSAKYWRFCIKTLEPKPSMIMIMMGINTGELKPEGIKVGKFILYNTERIDQWQDKAGFTPWKEDNPSYLSAGNDALNANEIIDLTSKMNADGSLNWEVPAGKWQVVRFGYSLTGRQNHPASPEATGLEVDKLDKTAVRKYINTYLDMYKDATGGQMGAKGLQYMVLDSYEAGHMNWTDEFAKEFKKRRAYDVLKWIPVLTGRIVTSAESSEKFLWDFRKTIGELIAENHYDVIGEELHKRGMKRYTESHEDKRIYLADGMDVKRNSDIPMSAMWTPGSLGGGNSEEVRSEGDIRESASVANIYGKEIVAAESMTSVGKAFTENPEKLKRTADLEMASGLNRFVIHTSVHQPLDDKKPGFSLGPFGQYFSRHETWSEVGGKAWMQYLGRSCYMFQKGKNIADILYLYGENTNITWLCREKLPNVPAGYEFDFVNSNALLNAISFKNGKLTAQSGNSYSVLMIDESAQKMTLEVLRKIKTLVDAGAKVVGNQPLKSPSLKDNDTDFQKLANQIWKSKNVSTSINTNTLPSADVMISNASNKILFRHRKSINESIYWLNNRGENATDADISFRESGKVPELWNAMTGKTEKLAYKIVSGRTVITLKFESWDAFFIVFKEATTNKSFTVKSKTETQLISIPNNWTLDIAGKTLNLDNLMSWNENTDIDIKYFSGTAAYINTFTLATIDKSANYILDLGTVKNVAEVLVNGKNLGTIWKQPFKLDISSALKTGENTIKINLTNLWVNRLVGDAQPDVKVKTTFVTMPFVNDKTPLLQSGLLGPVTISLSK